MYNEEHTEIWSTYLDGEHSFHGDPLLHTILRIISNNKNDF